MGGYGLGWVAKGSVSDDGMSERTIMFVREIDLLCCADVGGSRL